MARVLLADEPTSGLDSYAATRIFRLLLDLKRGGRAVLATLHQPTDLMFLGFDRLHLLLEGGALYSGPADGAVEAFSQRRQRPAGMPCADLCVHVCACVCMCVHVCACMCACSLELV